MFNLNEAPDNKNDSHLNLGAITHMTILWYGIGHHHRLETSIVDPRNRGSRENAMRQNGIHLNKKEY